MTEQEAFREAMAEVYRDRGLECGNLSDAVWSKVEAKLSPRHSKKGAICEVWDTPDEKYIRVATGNGGHFDADTLDDRDLVRWAHYREIPTALDALNVIAQLRWVNNAELPWTRCINMASSLIRGLIDNAMEG